MSAPPAIRKESEAAFQRAVIELARRAGWKVGHVHDSRRQVAPGRFVGDADAVGLPDLILARHGRLIFAELKSEKGKLRPEQALWLAELELCEAWTFVWRPSDWPEIESTLCRG